MSESTPCQRQKILLIDDDELIAGSLRQYLCMQGCEVDVAVETTAAATLMAAQQYDVVLVDPFLTGGVHGDTGELLGSVRALQPAASVIVLTGYDSPQLLAAAHGRLTTFLTKPQSIPFLSEVVVSASRSAADEPSIKGRPQ